MQRRQPPGYRQADSSKTNAERKALHKNAVYKAMQPTGIVQRAHTESSSSRTTGGSSSVKASFGTVPRFDGAGAVGLALKGKGEHRSEREIELLAVFMNQVPLLHQLGGLVLRRLCTLASCVLFEDGDIIMEAGTEADKYYVVVSGEVEACSGLHRRGAGDTGAEGSAGGGKGGGEGEGEGEEENGGGSGGDGDGGDGGEGGDGGGGDGGEGGERQPEALVPDLVPDLDSCRSEVGEAGEGVVEVVARYGESEGIGDAALTDDECAGGQLQLSYRAAGPTLCMVLHFADAERAKDEEGARRRQAEEDSVRRQVSHMGIEPSVLTTATHLLTYSLTHLLTYSLTHLLTYSLTHYPRPPRRPRRSLAPGRAFAGWSGERSTWAVSRRGAS